MEDGSCQQVKRVHFPDVDGYDNRQSHKKGDQYLNLNGGADKPRISLKPVLPHHNKFSTSQKTINNELVPIPKLNLKLKKSSNSSDSISDSDVVPKLPKPLITQYSTFRRVLKRTCEDFRFDFLENGDHKEHKKQPFCTKVQKFPTSSNKSKYFIPKKRKSEGSQPSTAEYAQYLGLQPAVKFKCSKCCCSSFQSLGMLKEHQRYCLPQAPVPPPPLPPAPAAGAPDTNFRITRKVYLCSACGTYYENWNLFLHIREVHNRHTCLFCFGMFSQAQKLASHLVIKHNIQEDHFASKEDLSAKFSDSFYLLCCKCEKVFNEREDFILHECAQVVKQCSVCNVKGSHSLDCPKNSKHKRPSLSPGESRKGKKNPLGDKKLPVSTEPTAENNTSAESASPQKPSAESALLDDACPPTTEKQLSPVGVSLKSDPAVENILQTTLPISKPSPSLTPSPEIDESVDSFPDVLKNNNNKEENAGSPISDIVEVGDLTKENICKTKGEEFIFNANLDLVKANHPISSEFTQNPDIYRDNFSPKTLPVSEERASNTSCVPFDVNMSQTGNESAKVALKPPPRNRRPPKRYQFKNLQQAVQKTELPQVKETVNRVPKLTVKVPKILTEKESTSDYSSESEDSDKLTVDFDMHSDSNGNGHSNSVDGGSASAVPAAGCVPRHVSQKTEATADVDIAVAGEDVAMMELNLDRPLDRYPLKDLLRVLLSSTVYSCIYCNHARKVAVNAKQLGLHFIAQHRFTAVVDSITAEELMPETIVLKIKSSLQEVQNIFLNLEGYDTEEKVDMKYYDHVLECFQCFFVTSVHKDLYTHNRKMHQKTILLCIMCKSNFYSYSELLCHLCPGTYVPNSEIQFRCCLCRHDAIPSAFRLMVHLRKRHHACDVCLETCQNQSKLSNHVWKHKLHHLCYRCGIAYRNKPDITKHLFWKHGTESVLCKKCLQKRWPHVYHFCIPPNSFVCEECNLTFTKAVSLKVHKRLHTNDHPYTCSEVNCTEKFISKKLLLKHEIQHLEPPMKIEEPPKPIVIDDKQEKAQPPAQCSKELDSVESNIESKAISSKNRKSKKNKRNKERDNLLIDVNLPALNLSESDSSEESEAESGKKTEDASVVDTGTTNYESPNAESTLISDIDSAVVQDAEVSLQKGDNLEEPTVDAPVTDIWDNFKIYQAEIGKQTEIVAPHKPKHVCDSDHDYCVIPITEEDHRDDILNISEGINKDSKKKIKLKKKNKKGNISSSSDSSSDSDSSCSCGSNCSCSSSSGSSSSSSSSDSESSSALRRGGDTALKDSDASAVDIMATEESPPRFVIPEPQEVPMAESDLDTDETETDEDFYDEHPQRIANKILAEKRNQLMLLATVAPVNNGTYLDSSRPVTPEVIEKVKEVKKKVKTKKKKKTRKVEAVSKSVPHPTIPITKICIRPPEQEPQVILPNKITISLQTNSVIDKSPAIHSPLAGSTSSRSDADNKRASKRRRVPNKFYGYSSDEEYALKSHLPPKLEWRKEDLPSPSVIQPPVIPEIPSLTEVLACESKPIVSPKIIFKEPIYSSSDDDSDSSREGVLQINHPAAEQMEPSVVESPVFSRAGMGAFPFPRPAGARPAREGESVYCYCRCPYDEVSEMIACDAAGCLIEWFHFECVGIMVPPKGMWYCPDCRQRLDNEDM